MKEGGGTEMKSQQKSQAQKRVRGLHMQVGGVTRLSLLQPQEKNHKVRKEALHAVTQGRHIAGDLKIQSPGTRGNQRKGLGSQADNLLENQKLGHQEAVVDMEVEHRDPRKDQRQ